MAEDATDAGAEGNGAAMNDDERVRDEINKRLTLNWLIQGAAQHAGMTLHYLVRDELNAIDPKLFRMYDQFALINLLQYWRTDGALVVGWPPRFWRRASTDVSHPFFGHRVLSRYGGMLAEATRKRAAARRKERGVSRVPILFSFQAVSLLMRLSMREAPHREALIELARRAAASVWGIPVERLHGELTHDVQFGDLSTPRSVRGKLFRACVVAYGGVVVGRDDSLVVVGKGRNWYLLANELVKGTAELICLHGLNDLDEDCYRRVIEAADRIEYEPWMLQTGGELWRRFLAVAPEDRSVATVLMHMARLPARSLESLVIAVIEEPEWARELLRGLGRAEEVA